MKNFMKIVVFVAALLFANAPLSAQERSVKMGAMVWDDTAAVSLITKKFLEKQGYDVELTTFFEWAIVYSAIPKSDIDILVSHINYAASDYWGRDYQRLEKISVLSHGLVQGIIVPSYVNINSLEELGDIRDAVRGRIIGIEPGTGLMREAAQAVKTYGLDYQIIDGSTSAMVAALQSAIERQEPIVTMTWQPSWIAHAYDFKFLADPKAVFAPPQSYYWIGRKGFSAENPHLRETLASIFIPVEDITRINADMNDGMSVEEAVDGWWMRNQDLVNRWAVMAPR